MSIGHPQSINMWNSYTPNQSVIEVVSSMTPTVGVVCNGQSSARALHSGLIVVELQQAVSTTETSKSMKHSSEMMYMQWCAHLSPPRNQANKPGLIPTLGLSFVMAVIILHPGQDRKRSCIGGKCDARECFLKWVHHCCILIEYWGLTRVES